VIGGGGGILAINLYQKRAATQTTQANARNVDAQTNSARANTVAPSNSTAAPVAPITSDTTGATKDSQAAAEQGSAGGVNAAQASSRGAGGKNVNELRAALGGWIDATNARDIDRQMNFYDAKLDAFYLSRAASREAVREEKARVFSRASTVEVRADEPQIELSADGQTATMRFRKQFNIEGGGGDKRGAVLQELRWRRTSAGWKITSERDLRVVN
jgi:ketosteroid isomerase-like protein